MNYIRRINGRILSFIALSVFTHTVNAIPFTFEGRSLGMAGVTVATADLATAAWANPAMLTNQRPDDDFSLLIGVGAFLRDNDDLVVDIDTFQEANDRLKAAESSGDVTGAAQAVVDMSAVINGVDGKVISPEVSAVAAMGIAFDSFAMAISIRADAIAAGTVTDLSCSALVDPTCDLARQKDEITSPDFNILNLEGLIATEVGLSLAKDFQVFERKFSVGIKPKIVDLQSFTFTESILTADAGFDSISDDENTRDLGTFTTVDLGLAYDISESVRLGFTARNLLTEQFDIDLGTINGAPAIGKLNFDTEARIGIAYHNNFFTVGIDYDLTENQPLLGNPAFDKLKTQYLGIGAEFNAFDYVQLRVGAAKNIAGGISNNAEDTAFTAGLGLWLGFNLDIAATLTDNSVGAFVQTGFRF